MTDRQRSWIRRASLAVAVLAALGTTLVRHAQLPYLSSAAIGLRNRHAAGEHGPRLDDAAIHRFDLSRAGGAPARAARSSAHDLARYEPPVDRRAAGHDAVPVCPAGAAHRLPMSRRRVRRRRRAHRQGWLDWFNDEILSALLRYGYAVLALTLLLGAIGLPLPTGHCRRGRGLAGRRRDDWIGLAAGLIAVAASVAGRCRRLCPGARRERAVPGAAWALVRLYRRAARPCARPVRAMGRLDRAGHPHAGFASEFGGQPARRHQPLSAGRVPGLCGGRPAAVDRRLHRPRLCHRRQPRGRDRVPEESERPSACSAGDDRRGAAAARADVSGYHAADGRRVLTAPCPD